MGAEISNSFSFVGERNAFLTTLIHFPFFPISLQEPTVQARSLTYIRTPKQLQRHLQRMNLKGETSINIRQALGIPMQSTSQSRLARMLAVRTINKTSILAGIALFTSSPKSTGPNLNTLHRLPN